MEKLTDLVLYHGSASAAVAPTFGLGDDRHDYGRGFYLSDNEALARDREARDRMDELIAGPRNRAVRVMSTLV